MPDILTKKMDVEYNGRKVSVAIEHRDRERLSITVHPDCEVSALVPMGYSDEVIRARIQRRASWIVKQVRHFERFRPFPAEQRYTSGETHLYLGRQYRLRVHSSDHAHVKMIGRFIHAFVPEPAVPSSVAAAMDDWYRVHACQIYTNRMQRCINSTKALQSVKPLIRIRRMRRRWGSCTRAGTVTLNLDLIKTPSHCIEYVIMHELCHMIIHDHSPAFYRLLGRCMPDWKLRKERLDSIVLPDAIGLPPKFCSTYYEYPERSRLD